MVMYVTPEKLHHMSPNIPDICTKCLNEKGTDLFNALRSKSLDFGLVQARRAMGLCWKSMMAPSLQMWIREMANCICLERLTYIAKGKREDSGYHTCTS